MKLRLHLALPGVELQVVDQVFLSSAALLTIRTLEGTPTCMQGVEALGSQKCTKLFLHFRILVAPAPRKACRCLARRQGAVVGGQGKGRRPLLDSLVAKRLAEGFTVKDFQN